MAQAISYNLIRRYFHAYISFAFCDILPSFCVFDATAVLIVVAAVLLPPTIMIFLPLATVLLRCSVTGLILVPETLNPKPYTINPKPQTIHPKPGFQCNADPGS